LISPSSPRTKTISVVLCCCTDTGGDFVLVEVKDNNDGSYFASFVTKQIKNLVLEATVGAYV